MKPIGNNNLRGIDVSHWQGDIDWDLVKKDGISFAYIKATEGVGYEDRNFSRNLQGAKKAGIFVGAYHFCTPSSLEDAVEEARHYIGVINKTGGFDLIDLPPVIDIEKDLGQSGEQITKIVRAWVETVKKETLIQPVIYSYTYFIRKYLDESLGDIPLWLAHYDNTQPPNCPGWKNWLFLQYTDKGVVNGINGNVDLNFFDSDLAGLESLCRLKFMESP